MITLGQIGAGAMARVRAAKFLARGTARFGIAWSRGSANLMEFAKQSGAEGVSDWRRVVQSPQIQGVCIATPVATHAQFALAALQAGRHVLLECPAAATVEDIDRMIAAADRAKRVLYIGSNYRLDPAASAIRYAADRIGKVLMAQGDSSWDPGDKAWYFDRALSGGLFVCVHLYQATLFHVLGPARWVHATFVPGGRYGVATIGYASGAIGVATGGLHAHGSNEFTLVGSEGLMRRQDAGGFAIMRGTTFEPIPPEPLDSTEADNACFLRCMDGREDWRVHAGREREIHALVIAAQRSAETGERVNV